MPKPGRLATILLAGLAMAACDGRKKQQAQLARDDAAVAPKAVAAHFALTTPDAQVELNLPAHIASYPELHRTLYEDGRQELEDFANQAREDRARYSAKGVRQRGPYVRKVSWTITAITPKLISLMGAWFDDTGGVHPNHGSQARIWDRQHNQMLLQSELFKAEADPAPLDAALCQAVTELKTRRMGPTDPRRWTCPKWADSQAVLAPSTQPYRIGGLTFLFDPYVIGAYAEGDYAVTIPLSVFQSALAPQWSADFTGSPAPAANP